MNDDEDKDDEKRTDYDVGYGKPPVEGQFQKGRSGNPGGRPKHPPTLDDWVEAQNKKKISFKRGDTIEETKGISLSFEQMYTRAINGSYSDARKLVNFLLAHYSRRLPTFLPIDVQWVDFPVDEDLLTTLRAKDLLRDDALLENVTLEEVRDAYEEYSESLPDARTHRERLDE